MHLQAPVLLCSFCGNVGLVFYEPFGIVTEILLKNFSKKDMYSMRAPSK